jgi:hypothetical protein
MCGKLIVKQMMDTVAEPWREALVGTPAIPMFEVKNCTCFLREDCGLSIVMIASDNLR